MKGLYNCRKGQLVGKVKVVASMLDKQIVGEEKVPESCSHIQPPHMETCGEVLLGNSLVEMAMEPGNMTDAQVAHKEMEPVNETHAQVVRRVMGPENRAHA